MKKYMLILTIVFLPFISPSLSFGGGNFPDLPGKTKMIEKCNTCHGLNSISRSKRSAKEWHKLIGQMKDYGLEITDEELKTVIDYLTRCCGKD